MANLEINEIKQIEQLNTGTVLDDTVFHVANAHDHVLGQDGESETLSLYEDEQVTARNILGYVDEKALVPLRADIDGRIKSVTEKIDAETERAEAGENDINEKLSQAKASLEEKLTQAETSLTEKITQSETTLNENITQTRASLEESLTQSQSSLEEKITQTETSLEEKITAETQRATQAEKDLSDRIDAGNTELGEKLSQTETSLEEKITQAETSLNENIAQTKSSLEEKINAKMDDVPLDPDGGIVKTDAGLAVSDIKEFHEATDATLLEAYNALCDKIDSEVTNMDAEGKVRDALAEIDLMDELGGRFAESITRLEQTFDQIYPVGSIYISVNNVKPPLGTWQKLATGVTLWNDPTPNGRTIAAGLPNITGTWNCDGNINNRTSFVWGGSGAFYDRTCNSYGGIYVSAGGRMSGTTGFNASRSNAIYGRSSTVQPPAIAVSMWQRTA